MKQSRVKHRRQPHKKSRSGCANCRFRRVKCDEGRPTCRKCQSYMIPCSYDTADLSSTGEQIIGKIDLRPQKSITLPVEIEFSPIAVSPSQDWRHEIILRFQNRTVFSIGSIQKTRTYANIVPRLAIEHDHLFHAIVAVTKLHDRALISSSQSSTDEIYHLGQAAARFNQKLSSAITDSDREALWATAVYMFTTSMYLPNMTDPEEVWPLKPPSPDDLRWLRFQAGLRIVWCSTGLTGQQSAFSYVENRTNYNCVFPTIPQPGTTGLPAILVELCDINEQSDGSNNPYHTAVRYLSWLLPMQSASNNVLNFMIFAGGMTKEFRDLLQTKDPRAILILAIWYSRLFQSQWWIAPRAIVECEAIYRYLDRLEIQDPVFRKVLDMVGKACELRTSQGKGSCDWVDTYGAGDVDTVCGIWDLAHQLG